MSPRGKKRINIEKQIKMSNKQGKKSDMEEIKGLIEKLLIVELGKMGMPQREIRKLLGVNINKVNSILKYFKKRYRR